MRAQNWAVQTQLVVYLWLRCVPNEWKLVGMLVFNNSVRTRIEGLGFIDGLLVFFFVNEL